MISTDILHEAARIVAGDRNTTHGEKERSFTLIADLWNAYLEGRREWSPIRPVDVAQMMVLLKVARSIQGTMQRDHFLDMAGYAAIAGELAASREKHQQVPLAKDIAARLAAADDADRAPVLVEDEVVATKPPLFAWSEPDPMFDPLGR